MKIYHKFIIVLISSILSPLSANDLPNILWITSEDNSPNLACYGDKNAETPHLDQLASEGQLYQKAYANSPVCSPARFTLFFGSSAQKMGTTNMRSYQNVPSSFKPYVHYLRQAGYYCVDRDKGDYNYMGGFDDPEAQFDEKIRDAFWLKSEVPKIGIAGARPKDQPFFCHLTIKTSHESRQAAFHDSIPTDQELAKIQVLPYQLDTKAVRTEWVKYYWTIKQMDEQVGRVREQLKREGLDQDTIIIYFSDHGGTLPRSKRYLYETGTRVPLITYFPKKYQHLAPGVPGSHISRLLSFADFAPTLLSLAGVTIPNHMEGKAFLGSQKSPEQETIFLARDRMDKIHDTVRALRKGNLLYIRNYMPHRPVASYTDYRKELFPSIDEAQKTYSAGKGPVAMQRLYQDKEIEELYDVVKDPWQVNNLASDASYQQKLIELRQLNAKHIRAIKDPGFVPQTLFGKRGIPYEYVRQSTCPIQIIIETAEMVNCLDKGQLPKLIKRLHHPHPAVRFWAATGCLALKHKALPAKASLFKLLHDESYDVRLVAAKALSHMLAETSELLPVIIEALEQDSETIFYRAWDTLRQFKDQDLEPFNHKLQNLNLKHWRFMKYMNPFHSDPIKY